MGAQEFLRVVHEIPLGTVGTVEQGAKASSGGAELIILILQILALRTVGLSNGRTLAVGFLGARVYSISCFWDDLILILQTCILSF